jgi:DNA invertase Pin-like site-specific DNA recombinase
MTKAYGYLRVSGRGQVDGDGFPRQRAAIEAHAAAAGITVAGWFEEKAVPGKTEWEDRPSWVDMLAAVRDNGVRMICIEKLDRLARDLMVQEHIIADLRERSVQLVSVAEPDLNSDDPTRVLMRQIMGAIAQYDKTMIVLKLRSARDRIKARGERCEGKKPYGHYPGEEEGLEIIREAHADGATTVQTVNRLRVAGVQPRTGGEWHPFVVERIMARL